MELNPKLFSHIPIYLAVNKIKFTDLTMKFAQILFHILSFYSRRQLCSFA